MADSRLTHADVERIIRLAEEAGFGLLQLEVDGVEIELVKGDVDVAALSQAVSPAVPAPSVASAPTDSVAASAPAPAPASAAARAPAAPAAAGPEALPVVDVGEDDPGVVRSPMVGIFYRAPDPESSPYVEVGQRVEAGATVGLVEVMKMFTAVTSPVSGTVTEVLAANAAQVDRGAPLVRVAGS